MKLNKIFLKKTNKLILNRIISYLLIMACIFTCLFGINGTVFAKDEFTSRYKQTIFNQENGLGSSGVNCIYQTLSGYIWIGTDGGLYRYNGNEFRVVNLWDTEKADVYCVNSLFQDSSERLWVSTENYGLFYIKGSHMQHFSSDYYDGIKRINSVIEGNNGEIYVASPNGLYIVDEEEMLLREVPELKDNDIIDLVRVDDGIAGIAYNADGAYIFKLDDLNMFKVSESGNYTEEDLSCISFNNGYVFVGTTGKEVIKLRTLDSFEVITTAFDGINDIYNDSDGKTFVLADNGIGYLDSNDQYIELGNMSIDSYYTSMIKDREGNYWFSSSRLGVLLLGVSKFSNYNMEYSIPESITNCFLSYRGYNYIGTDQGLIVTNIKNEIIENELTEKLADISIRHIMADDAGNLWISTYRRYGVVKVDRAGNITTFGRSAKIISNMVNATYLLNDGTIAVATEEGISIINKDGSLVQNIGAQEGLEYSNITAIYQDESGRIFAGSDGGGLYIIDKEHVYNYSETEGLTSNVVTCFLKGENGLYIGTDNGLSLYNETIRQVSNIDFSNSIYDILSDNDDIYIIGSKGILKTNEEELLSSKGIEGRYWNKNDGLDKTITLNTNCYIDSNHLLYICCNQGVSVLDTKNIHINETAPKLIVSEIEVDGEKYLFDQLGGLLTVDSDTSKITINFGVLTYTNRDNIEISYCLNGFDKEPVTLSGGSNLQAVYTNLDGGNYTFVIEAVNGDGVKSEQDVSFVIEKKMGLFERKAVQITLILLILVVIGVIVLLILRFNKAVTGKNKEIEELSKEHEVALKKSTAKTDYLANMSNEIKTPINAIIKMSESMLSNGQTSIENIEKLHSIIDSGNVIIEKVDGIILLAKLESGKVQPVNATYSITTLVCDLSDKIINELGERPIKFFVEIGDNIPDILIGDFDKIKEVLELILDNAQKFTKEGSITLAVDCYLYNDESSEDTLENLVFTISDTGVGIVEERLEHIFEVYNIADNKKSSGYTGNGIGLAIAKKLTDIMGGELVCESTYGAGSTFTLSLVQKKPEKNIFQSEVDAGSLQLVSKEEAERLFTPDITALLVEDMEVNRTVALSVLNQLEMKVDIATSGIGAIDMVMNNTYDIVFMDLTMPVMSGEDAMHEIRELDGDIFKNIPIIAMTEDAVGEDRKKVIESGFNDVILKPMDIRSLATVIIEHVPNTKIKHRTNNMIQYMRESRYNEGLEELQNSLEVVNILEKIGGSIDVYNKILSTFYTQNANAEEELRIKFDKDYRGFRNRIHNIKTGSLNIGARDVSAMASKLESAINIGNKDYIRDNLGKFFAALNILISDIEGYLKFVEDKQGMTDEEYAAKIAREKQEEKELEESVNKFQENVLDRIDRNLIGKLQDSVDRADLHMIRFYFEDIKSFMYNSEDLDFINALQECMEQNDFETMKEMLITYVNLKYEK